MIQFLVPSDMQLSSNAAYLWKHYKHSYVMISHVINLLKSVKYFALAFWYIVHLTPFLSMCSKYTHNCKWRDIPSGFWVLTLCQALWYIITKVFNQNNHQRGYFYSVSESQRERERQREFLGYSLTQSPGLRKWILLKHSDFQRAVFRPQIVPIRSWLWMQRKIKFTHVAKWHNGI